MREERKRRLLDRQKRLAYNKMMRKYKKLLIKHAKESQPWDYSFGFDILVEFLRWMHEYYKLGYNVYALDITDPKEPRHTEKTREESLRETLMWYNRWNNVDDDYIKIVHTPEELSHYLNLGFHLREDASDDFVIDSSHKVHYYYLTLYEDHDKNSEELVKARELYKHNFFSCLEKYLSEWWD